jgi:hypothetical protein
MIITIHNQATSEERAHLMALLCRITGSQHPITTTTMSGCEVIALDGQQIDSAASTALEQLHPSQNPLPACEPCISDRKY